MTRTTSLAALAGVVAVSGLLSACAPIMIGSAVATTALVATDRRTVGQQVSDQEIELKVSSEISTTFGNTARINVSSYERVVLLTGDAFSEKIRGEAAAIAANTNQVRSVINRLNVGPLASFSQITSDTWLSSKVKTTLITAENVPYGAIKITVERDNVYLQGLVTEAESTRIAEVVSGVGGVKEVYTLFNIMTPEQAQALRTANQPVDALPASNPTPSGVSQRATGSGGSTSSMDGMAEPQPGAPNVAPVVAPAAPQARPL
jgi:osmotically-inducible protein OsmY